MAIHAPITGAPTRAPFIPAPPAAITRILSQFDRDQLASFIVVAIDLLDVAAGDPDLEDGHDAEGSIWVESGPRGNSPNLSDDHEEAGDEGDASFPEWASRPARFRHGNAALGHEDAEDDGDELDGNGAEDDFIAHEHDGPGCPIADGHGDAAWPEADKQPGYMFGGLAGTPGDEDAEPWQVAPVTAAPPLNDNEVGAA